MLRIFDFQIEIDHIQCRIAIDSIDANVNFYLESTIGMEMVCVCLAEIKL